MSAVKIKNTVLKALNAAIASGELPKGVTVSGQLKEHRIWVHIDDAPFQVLLAKNYRFYPTGISFSLALNIGGGPDTNHTPEGISLLAKAESIVKAICPKGTYVTFSSTCYSKLGRRLEADRAAAATVTIDHEYGPGGRIDLTTPIRCF